MFNHEVTDTINRNNLHAAFTIDHCLLNTSMTARDPPYWGVLRRWEKKTTNRSIVQQLYAAIERFYPGLLCSVINPLRRTDWHLQDSYQQESLLMTQCYGLRSWSSTVKQTRLDCSASEVSDRLIHPSIFCTAHHTQGRNIRKQSRSYTSCTYQRVWCQQL